MEKLTEGLTLLALGMGFVISFLGILIASMHVMSDIVLWLNKIFPVAAEETERKSSAKVVGDDSLIALAIAAARYRR